MVFHVHSHTVLLIRDGEKGVEGREVGEEGDHNTYLSLYCHHQNDACIKMGSDESHFKVSLIVRNKVTKTVSTNHNLFEEKGEPKRDRAEALLITSLIALPLGQTGSRTN